MHNYDDLYPPMQHKRRDKAPRSHHCCFGGCSLMASFLPVWSHAHIAQNLWLNLTCESKEFALKFSRKIFLELEKQRGLICLWGISMFGKWKEWEQKGKTHHTPVIQLPTNHYGIAASTFSHETPGTYSHLYVAAVASKWLDILIRLIRESAALYPSATLAWQVNIIANNTYKLIYIAFLLT